MKYNLLCNATTARTRISAIFVNLRWEKKGLVGDASWCDFSIKFGPFLPFYRQSYLVSPVKSSVYQDERHSYSVLPTGSTADRNLC